MARTTRRPDDHDRDEEVVGCIAGVGECDLNAAALVLGLTRQCGGADDRADDRRDRPRDRGVGPRVRERAEIARRTARSEEHTSELQSLTNLVCRLLLEKK